MGEDLSHGNIAATGHEVPTSSGWVSTQQTARALGISPRTVRWHIEQGNLEANLEGRRVKRTWFVSIDSLQAFREARRVAALLPETLRTPADESEMAASIPGNPIGELADRLAEEAARAAEVRLRLKLAAQAQSALKVELAEEQRRREEAERERDELKLRGELGALRDPLPEPREEALRSATQAPSDPADDVAGFGGPQTDAGRLWWKRIFRSWLALFLAMAFLGGIVGGLIATWAL